MTRGVDTALFTPARRSRRDTATVNIGYVGRLSTEKNVRALASVQRALIDAGLRDIRFTIVGDGAEQPWLREHLAAADFTGVLRGDPLADAYANFDLFLFPSETETVGNVVLEAMASGVPVVAMARGGAVHRHFACSAAAAVNRLAALAVQWYDARDGVRWLCGARRHTGQSGLPSSSDTTLLALRSATGTRGRHRPPAHGLPEKQSAA